MSLNRYRFVFSVLLYATLWGSKFHFKSAGAQYSGQPCINTGQDKNLGWNDAIFSAKFHANTAVICLKNDGSDPILRETLVIFVGFGFACLFLLTCIKLQWAVILICYIWNNNLWTCNKLSEGKINSIRLIVSYTFSLSIEF